MKKLLACASFAVAGLVISCLADSPARANYEILVTETGGPTIPIVDNGPLDTNTTDPGVITVNTAALNGLLAHFAFSELGSESNRPTGTPFSNASASLSQDGSVIRAGDLGGVFTISITAFDTDFLFPAGQPKTMTTGAGDTFRFTTSGDSRTFQSFFDPTNLTPPGLGIASPLLAFIPPIGDGPFQTSNPGVITPLGVQPIPFGISNTTIITLGPSRDPSSPQSDRFDGLTTINGRAVPEPGSMALMGVGGLALLGYDWRRRARG